MPDLADAGEDFEPTSEPSMHPEAELELYRAVAYYDLIDLDLGERVLDAFHAAMLLIERYPLIGSELFDDSFKHVFLAGFPCFLAYQVEGRHAEVLAVMNAARDPASLKAILGKRATGR
jgi:hypothetical protein